MHATITLGTRRARFRPATQAFPPASRAQEDAVAEEAWALWTARSTQLDDAISEGRGRRRRTDKDGDEQEREERKWKEEEEEEEEEKEDDEDDVLDEESVFSLLRARRERREALRLSGCVRLTRFPPELFLLGPSLVRLDLSANSLTELPPDAVLAQLPLLEELHVCGNRLASLPRGLGRSLPSLRHLCIIDNAADAAIELPSSLGVCRNLRALDLRRTPHLGVPAELWVQPACAGAEEEELPHTVRKLAIFSSSHQRGCLSAAGGGGRGWLIARMRRLVDVCADALLALRRGSERLPPELGEWVARGDGTCSGCGRVIHGNPPLEVGWEATWRRSPHMRVMALLHGRFCRRECFDDCALRAERAPNAQMRWRHADGVVSARWGG
jgi:hypothetical protein